MQSLDYDQAKNPGVSPGSDYGEQPFTKTECLLSEIPLTTEEIVALVGSIAQEIQMERGGGDLLQQPADIPSNFASTIGASLEALASVN
jgi:hypothetical protein